jgi:urease accessory protein
MNVLARFRLLQLASQALPIGGFSYSHGLESAVEAGLVHDEASVAAWIFDIARFSMVRFDLPLLIECRQAWQAEDFRAVSRCNGDFLASRESAEFRAAAVQTGYSMRALCATLPDFPPRWYPALESLEEPAPPCVWGALGAAWCIGHEDLATAYLWSWMENQVLAAVKSMPLGQSAGQRILANSSARITHLAGELAAEADLRSNFAPGLAILSARHETQYSRLFRS